MKLRSLAGIFAATVALTTSCSSSRYKAEDLAVPVLQAIQDNDFDDLECMLPSDKVVNEVFASNTAALGGNFYNKYTRSYRRLNLATAIHNDLEMIHDISTQNNLNWNDAQWGSVTKEDVTDSAASYTRLTVPLKFGTNEYTLSIKTAQYNGIWYLLDDIYMTKTRKQS